MCDIDELDECSVWSETQATARKPRACSICRAPIGARERYTKHFSVFEGAVCSATLCTECQSNRCVFAAAHGGTWHQPPEFVRALVDCIAEGDEDSERLWQPMVTRIRDSMTRRRERRG